MDIVLQLICAAISLLTLGFIAGFAIGKLTSQPYERQLSGAERAIEDLKRIAARDTVMRMYKSGLYFTEESNINGFTLRDLGMESLIIDPRSRATGDLLN